MKEEDEIPDKTDKTDKTDKNKSIAEIKKKNKQDTSTAAKKTLKEILRTQEITKSARDERAKNRS